METPEIPPETMPASLPPSPPAAASLPRRTLAMRMAERSRLRAERLARLAPVPHPGEGEAPPVRAGAPAGSPEPDAAAALEEFLRSLTRGLGAPPGAAAPAGEVLPFPRPAPPEAGPAGAAAGIAPDSELGRLAGVGPGLAWALRRAGIPDLASVAALEPEALAARLGPLGRLVPARAWVEAARAAPDLG